jgi:hypothetical protein
MKKSCDFLTGQASVSWSSTARAKAVEPFFDLNSMRRLDLSGARSVVPQLVVGSAQHVLEYGLVLWAEPLIGVDKRRHF